MNQKTEIKLTRKLAEYLHRNNLISRKQFETVQESNDTNIFVNMADSQDEFFKAVNLFNKIYKQNVKASRSYIQQYISGFVFTVRAAQ